MPNDYKAILTQALEEFGAVLEERQELDLKVARKLQFIRATMNQLPEDEKVEFEDRLQKLASRSVGLSDSIRRLLRENSRKWHTGTQVLDALIKSGFDFGNYASNPLASVRSALKRLKSGEAERHCRCRDSLALEPDPPSACPPSRQESVFLWKGGFDDERV
jgi:hypothetical protein